MEREEKTITLTIPVRVLECLWAGGNYSTATLPLADAVAMNALCHAAWLAALSWKSEAADDDRNHYGACQLEMAEELIAAIRKAEGGAR